ncbi:hypothetical protein, partial [Enterococcus entomosocium]|uniref:hypothetical protein n=1 Tax=Enterococcus entomosocium TaxID=3034352 RepID=UPI002649C218
MEVKNKENVVYSRFSGWFSLSDVPFPGIIFVVQSTQASLNDDYEEHSQNIQENPETNLLLISPLNCYFTVCVKVERICKAQICRTRDEIKSLWGNTHKS